MNKLLLVGAVVVGAFFARLGEAPIPLAHADAKRVASSRDCEERVRPLIPGSHTYSYARGDAHVSGAKETLTVYYAVYVVVVETSAANEAETLALKKLEQERRDARKGGI